MKNELTLQHKFVEYIPEELENSTIYISMKFATAVHKCCSGCGKEVVTPLSPAGWSMTFNGESVSLDPSIGNWNLPCQSHYWIKNNKVRWAPKWSREEIEAGRSRDRVLNEKHFDNSMGGAQAVQTKETPWRKFRSWFK